MIGLVGPDQVPPLQVAQNAQWVDYEQGRFSASEFIEYTIEDIIEMHGERNPSVYESQKAFRALTFILTVDPLTENDWQTPLHARAHTKKQSPACSPAFWSNLLSSTLYGAAVDLKFDGT